MKIRRYRERRWIQPATIPNTTLSVIREDAASGGNNYGNVWLVRIAARCANKADLVEAEGKVQALAKYISEYVTSVHF